jgi:acyl carrier protein/short-subunit dehydrogenase
MVALFQQIKSSLPPLRGIVHAAGMLDDGILERQNWQRFSSVMSAKVSGTWNLHRLTLDLPLDFFVMFSSAAALLGSPGQGNYAAANAFLDALSSYRRGQGLPALSINWGPWAGDGMASGETQKALAKKGLKGLSPEIALKTLEYLLGTNSIQILVADVEWKQFKSLYESGGQRSLLAEIASQPQQDSELESVKPLTLLEQLKKVSGSDRQEFLMSYIQSQVLQVLGMESANLPERDRGFSEMGIDSLMAVEIKNRLEKDLEIPLPTTIVLEYPTIQGLARHLMAELLGKLTTEEIEPSKKETSNISLSEIELSKIEELTGEDIEAAITEELAALETILQGN